MKPYLVCFDTETTGLDVQRDWIIQLSLVKVDARTFEEVGACDWYIKPSGAYTIAPEAQAVHHITREVLEREGVALKDIYPQMMAFLQDCDILSYNGNGFDARILYYNLQREGLSIDYDAYRFYDAYLIEMARTSRRLTDVYRRYYGKEFDDAHNSLADVRATIAVFKAQQETSEDPQEFCRPDFDFISVDGFLAIREGQKVFAQGKYKGKTIDQVQQAEAGYLDWVLKNCAEPTRQLIEQVRHPKPQQPPKTREKDKSAAKAPHLRNTPGTPPSSPAKKNTPPSKLPAGTQTTLEF